MANKGSGMPDEHPSRDPWAFGDPNKFALIYARSVSHEGYEPELMEHLEACHLMAGRLGAYVMHEYVDGGYCGATLKRPALMRLLQHAMDEDIDYAIASNAEELTCSQNDMAFLITALGGYGTEIAIADINAIVRLNDPQPPESLR